MPTYDFKNNDTGEVKEYSMSISEMEQFKKDNQHLLRLTPFTPSELEEALIKKLNIEEMVSTIFAATILNNKSNFQKNTYTHRYPYYYRI